MIYANIDPFIVVVGNYIVGFSKQLDYCENMILIFILILKEDTES